MMEVPRVKTRVHVGDDSSAESTTVWEQWIPPQGHIPPHYHEVEEVLVILSGEISITLDNTTSIVQKPATILIPKQKVHSLEPHGPNEVHLLAFFPITSPKIIAPDGTLRPMPWEDRKSSKE